MALQDIYVKIKKPFGPPLTPAFSMPLVTDAEWDALATRSNIWRFDLATKDNEPRIAGVGVAWQYGSDDTYRANWTPQIDPDEQAQVDTVQAQLQEELDAETNQERVTELQAMIADLGTWAYWEEKRNLFGDGAVGLYRSCSTPNVPFRIRSNWTLEEDRPFTLWLHRAKPAEGQRDASLTVQFGDWRLEFRQERECKLVQLAPLTDAQRAAYEEEMTTLLDDGRLTATDKEQIAEWHDAIATVKETAKLAGRKGDKALLPAEHAQITGYQQSIDALKESKSGTTGASQARIDALEKLLYLQSEDVNLQETTQTLFETDLPITIIPQRRGYLSIHLGRGANYSTIEVKSIKQRKQLDTVIRRTPVEISGNGGALWFKCSYVRVEKTAQLLSASRNAGFPVPDGASFVADWSADEGCSATLNLSRTGNRFTWQIDVLTDGKRLPFIYNVLLEVPATPRDRSIEEVVFDSRHYPTMMADYTPKWDGDKRSRGMTVELNIFDGDYRPEEWANHQIEVYEGELVFTGVILQTPVTEVIKSEQQDYERVSLECGDRWVLLKEDALVTQLTGDGKLLGAYQRQIVASRGFWPDEMNIPDGTFRLPQARPGEEPLVRSEWGKHQGEWLEYLHENYGHGLRMGATMAGVIETAAVRRTVSEIVFRRVSDGDHDPYAIWDVTRALDWDECYNDFVVIGALKPGSKTDRYAARFADSLSVTDPTRPNYRGNWRPMEPRRDDALNTQELVNLACRQAQALHGNPREDISFTCRYSPNIEPGLVCWLEDGTVEKQVEVITADAGSREENTLNVTVRVIYA